MAGTSFRIESLEPRTLLAGAPMAEVQVHFQIGDVKANPQRNVVYLLDMTNWQVRAFDTDRSRNVAQSPVLAVRPTGLGVSPDGNQIFVALPGAKKIQVLNASNLSITRSLNVDFVPLELGVGANNRLYVLGAHDSIDDYFEVNASSGQTVKLLATMSESEMQMRPDGRRLYLNGSVWGAAGSPVIAAYDTSSGDASRTATYAGSHSGFAIDEQYHRAYLPGSGALSVRHLDSGAVDNWKLAQTYWYVRHLALNEAGDDVFVQQDSHGIRQFRRSDGALVADYETVWQASVLGIQATSNGRAVFVESDWDGSDFVHHVGIIGASSIKVEDTPPDPKFTATAYSSQNFLFDATTSKPGAIDETITEYRWDFGDGTNASGNTKLFHVFASAGTYDVRLTISDSNGDSKSVTTKVTAGDTSNTASIAGLVFSDQNLDGKDNDYSNGSGGIPNRLVFIDSNLDGKRSYGEHVTTTDDRGFYTLLGLSAGTYRVRLVVGADEAITAPRYRYWNVTLAGGQQFTGRNFARALTAVQHVSVRSDLNANDIGNYAEPMLPNRTVYFDSNDNQILDKGEATYRTDAAGVCDVHGLLPSKYNLRTIVATGERFMRTYKVEVWQAMSSDLMIPVRPKGTSTLAGIVFDDPNLDGVHQKTEAALAGQTVFVDVDHDGVHDADEPSTTSNASGFYSFGGLDAGQQFVGIVPSRGWRSSASIRNQRDLLVYQESNINRHIGLTTRPQVRGRVFLDANQNRLLDANEHGLRNRTVFADLNFDGIFDAATEPNARTDSHGRYQLTLPSAGKYTIRLLPATGYFTATPTGAAFANITFKNGQLRNGYSFGGALSGV